MDVNNLYPYPNLCPALFGYLPPLAIKKNNMEIQKTKTNDLAPRVDRNLAHNHTDFKKTFGQHGGIIEDILLYAQNSYITAEDFYGGVRFNFDRFCEMFNYNPTNLRRKIPELADPGTKLIDGKDHELITVFEHALDLMGSRNMKFTGKAQTHAGGSVQKMDYVQLIKSFYILRKSTNDNTNNKAKVYYLSLSDEMIRNIARYYISGFKLDHIGQLRKYKLKGFYFGMLELRSMCTVKKNVCVTEATTLFKMCGLKNKRERQNKYQINVKFEKIKKITGVNWELKWTGDDGWTPEVYFYDITPEDKKLRFEISKKMLEQYFRHQLYEQYNRKYGNDNPTGMSITDWYRDQKLDRHLKERAYQVAYELIYNKEIEPKHADLCKRLNDMN